MKETEQAAFPVQDDSLGIGLTKRELFAALCLNGLLSNSSHFDATYEEFKNEEERQALRNLAIDHADKLLAQLQETDDQTTP